MLRVKIEHIIYAVPVALLIKGCVIPSWQSVCELLGALFFVGFITYLNPFREPDIKRKEFEELAAQYQTLKEQLVNIRVTLGFQKR